MRHQQVVIDYAYMVKTSFLCLMVVFSGWILLKLVQTIFWFPSYLEDQQSRLYETIERHEKEMCSGANVGSSVEANSTEQVDAKNTTASESVSTDTKPEEKKTN